VILRALVIAGLLWPVLTLAEPPRVVGTSEAPADLIYGISHSVTSLLMRDTKCAKLEELQPHPAPPELLPPKEDWVTANARFELWTAFGCELQHTILVEWGLRPDGTFYVANREVPPNYRWSGP
jgi:hypothetical protein